MNEDLLKKPYWKPLGDVFGLWFKCSRCGEVVASSVMGKPRYRFCPMCGVRMSNAVGVEEDGNDSQTNRSQHN